MVRDDGAWLLPIFRCVTRPGQKWNGSHDVAAVGVSADGGQTWRFEEVPGSIGSVHMGPVDLGGGRLAAFYHRRRQADFGPPLSDSTDGGRTWSAPVATDMPNNNSSVAAIRLNDGRIAVIGNPVNAAMSPDRRASLYDELGEDDARPDADLTGGLRAGLGRAARAGRRGAVHRWRRDLPAADADRGRPAPATSNDLTDGRNREMSIRGSGRFDGTLHLAYTYHRRAIKYVRLSPKAQAALEEQTA